MWTPLIFLLLGQAYLLGADPIPVVEGPHNALRWIEEEVVAADKSDQLLWLRELLKNDHGAASSWIKDTLNDTRHVVTLLDTWFAANPEIVAELRREMAIESWYIDQALDENQDAATWESLKAGRNDTEYVIGELRETLSNDTLIYTIAIKELESKGFDESEIVPRVLAILAAAALSEDDHSVVHNASWWVKQILLTDTSDKTSWLRDELLENPETASIWLKEALRNTRDTVATVSEGVKRWPEIATKLAQNTENALWYINQALEENQQAGTWYQRKSTRDDTEEAVAWIRETVTNSTQEALTWFQRLAKNQPGEAARYLRFILVGEPGLYDFDPATEGPPFWLKLIETKSKHDPYPFDL